MSLALLSLGAMVGCGVSKGVVHKATRLNGKLLLDVAISSAANQNSPVAVDLLLIKDKAFLKTAQGMTAGDWFGKKRQFERQYSKILDVKSWEWVPGQSIAPISFAVPPEMEGAVVFANYASPGPHSAPIPARGKVSISLEEEDFTIESK